MSHSMFCNSREDKPCDCHVSRRKPFGKTWFDTGKAHYDAGLVCDERYTTEYMRGYAYAANIVGITTYKLLPSCFPIDFCECAACKRWIETGEAPPDEWQADCGNDHSRGNSEAEAIARLIRWVLGKREQAEFERRTLAAEQDAMRRADPNSLRTLPVR